jgi:hypothetical protein
VQFSSSNCDDFEDFPVQCSSKLSLKKLIEDWDKLKPKFKQLIVLLLIKGGNLRLSVKQDYMISIGKILIS